MANKFWETSMIFKNLKINYYSIEYFSFNGWRYTFEKRKEGKKNGLRNAIWVKAPLN